MYRYPDGTYRQSPPARVEYSGYVRNFADLTPAERDELGYNEAVPLKREPYTAYETEWVKGVDLIYREAVVSRVVDTAAKMSADIASIEEKYDKSLTVLDNALLNTLWADGVDEATIRSYLATQRATILANRDAEIMALMIT